MEKCFEKIIYEFSTVARAKDTVLYLLMFWSEIHLSVLNYTLIFYHFKISLSLLLRGI